MDRAEAFLGGLRARAALSGSPRVEPAQAEALAVVLGISSTDLPGLVTDLSKRSPPAVEVVWGGRLDLLPAPAPSSNGTIIDNRYATFGDYVAIAGIGNAENKVVEPAAVRTLAEVVGTLAEVLAELREIRPRLSGDGPKVATEAEAALATHPAPVHASPVERRNWAATAGDWLTRVLKAAPEVKDLVELGTKAATELGGD